MEAMRVLDRMPGLVPHDRHARLGRSTFDRMHLSTLESHESWVGKVEGNRNSRDPARRKPILGQPHVWTHSQRAFRKLVQQLLMTAHDPFAGLRQTQLPKAQREQTLVTPPGPWGRLVSPAGHPHIQRSSDAQRNWLHDSR